MRAMVLALLLLAPAAAMMSAEPEHRHTDTDVGMFEDFAHAVDVSGDLAVAGTDGADRLTLLREGTPWTAISLHNPTADEFGGFGEAVALDGHLLVVGAPYEDFDSLNAGAVHWYDVSGEPRLLATIGLRDPGPGDYLGMTVALSGTVAVAGAPLADDWDSGWPDGSFVGRAVVMRAHGDGVRAVEVDHPTGEARSRFGDAVATDGQYVAISAPGADDGAGRVWIYAMAHHVQPRLEPLYSIGATGEATLVAASGRLALARDGVVDIVDLATGDPLARLGPSWPQAESGIECAIYGVFTCQDGPGYHVFDFTGTRMVAAAAGALHVWSETADGWHADVAPLPAGDRVPVALAVDGDRVALGDGVDTIVILSLETLV